MFRILLVLAIMLVALAAQAEDFSLLFPELTGDYEVTLEGGTRLTTTFMFDSDVESLQGLRMLLSGSWTEGTIICSYGEGIEPDTSAFTPGVSMFLTVPGEVDGFFHATIQPPDGDFDFYHDIVTYCCPSGPGDPNLLLGQVVTVELFCEIGLILPCRVGETSYGTLDEVRLDVIGAVPTDSETWGAVKSLFR